MIVSFDMPIVANYSAITGGTLLTSYSFLTDQMPGVTSRFQTGAVGATPVVITANLATSIPVSWPYLFVGISNCSLPSGTQITLSSNNGWNYTSTGGLSVNNIGVNSYFAVIRQANTQGSTAANQFKISIANTGITNTQFTLGEIWCAPAIDVKLTDISVRLIDQGWTSRSAFNQAYPVMRAPYRRFQCKTMPAIYQDAFANAASWPINLAQLQYKLATNKVVGICPRWRQRGSGIIVPDQTLVAASACLARIPADGLGDISSNASDDYWPSQLTFEEIL